MQIMLRSICIKSDGQKSYFYLSHISENIFLISGVTINNHCQVCRMTYNICALNTLTNLLKHMGLLLVNFVYNVIRVSFLIRRMVVAFMYFLFVDMGIWLIIKASYHHDLVKYVFHQTKLFLEIIISEV